MKTVIKNIMHNLKWLSENMSLLGGFFTGLTAVVTFLLLTKSSYFPNLMKWIRSVSQGDKRANTLKIYMDENSLIHIVPQDEKKYEFQFVFVVGVKTKSRYYTKESFKLSSYIPFYKAQPFVLATSNFNSEDASVPIPVSKENLDPTNDYFSVIICYNEQLETNYTLVGQNFYTGDKTIKKIGHSVVINNGQKLPSPVKRNLYFQIDSLFNNVLKSRQTSYSVEPALQKLKKEFKPDLVIYEE